MAIQNILLQLFIYFLISVGIEGAAIPQDAITSENQIYKRDTDGPDSLRLRLIVKSPPTTDMPAFNNVTITLNGTDWYLTELFRTPDNAASFINYTAISYRWYDGRLDNPFFDGYLMSNLTIPSLESAMRNSQQSAFWIDCFSIPAENPLKGTILDLLSNIFSAAHEVMVPLGLSSRSTFQLLAGKTALNTVSINELESAMVDLEADAWVKSIWTYKESLNAKQYYFTDRDIVAATEPTAGSEPDVGDQESPNIADIADTPDEDTTSASITATIVSTISATSTSSPVESSSSIVVVVARATASPEPIADATAFFNRVGEAVSAYKTAKNVTSFDIRQSFPHLDALEDLGADWTSQAPYNRSTFAVVANLDLRYAENANNYFWGLYGSITETVLHKTKVDTINDWYARLFEVCEEKNDYSFIYTSTARNETEGWKAYPQSAPISSIASWYSEGFSQKGVRNATGFYLEAMVSMTSQATLGTTGKSFLDQFYETGVPSFSNVTLDGQDSSYEKMDYELLKIMGFNGSSVPIFTDAGMFFPMWNLTTTTDGVGAGSVGNDTEILVATQVSWSFGAPGLLVVGNGNGNGGGVEFVPGAYLGEVSAGSAREVLLE